jgi:hypothetical protein
MTFTKALSELDRERANQTLDKLARHDISGFALTGGFATEQHIKWHGVRPLIRPLHNVDFIVRSFESIPESLGQDFLLRHIHPDDPPGKTLLQFVDPDTSVRLDVFRASGSVMDRVLMAELGFGVDKVVSLEDLTARAARLSWDLSGDDRVAPKYVRDFIRLLEVANADKVAEVWQEHRNRHSPQRFSHAANEIERLIEARSNRLVAPIYSTDVDAFCARCRETAALKLADASRILAMLGYC